jgi:hypothetical protein
MAALVRDRLDAIYSCLGQSRVGGSAKAAKRKIGWGERVVTVKLDLKPEVEAALLAQAHARGLSLEAYLNQVLENATSAKRPAGRKNLAQLFAESPLKGLALSFDRNPDVGRPVKKQRSPSHDAVGALGVDF